MIPAMYALFTTALIVIAFVDRRLIAARWAALGFFVAFVSILVDGLRDPGGDRWVSWFTVATHFLPLLIMVQAFLSRHGKNAPAWACALFVLASIYVMPNMPWAPPNWLRGVLVQATCATIIASGLLPLWRYRRQSVVDLIAFAAIALACLSYVGRSVVIYITPIGESAEAIQQFYNGLNIAFHSASALMGMTVGIVLMMTIGSDIVRLRMEESEIDPLTGLANRRRLERVNAQDAAGKLSVGGVIAVDLDHFKRVNDSFGHDAGDEVLRKVGSKLNKLFGELGTVCRTGGEEFVILLDRDHVAAISQLSSAARVAIAGLRFDGVLSAVTVTASVGFHERGEDEEIGNAIRRADQAVYCAKTDGRNRVVGVMNDKGFHVLRAVA
ncbi:sensor domain-containing diguanylate cyclase [Aurantiacibacter gangjinensis]|uniref:GGDEF domain-containing protein n=1 Tax=Aurantiacibacter gangjinensis TaxID=502682 RepID=UPI00138DD26F|nr:GGDEF domain-containing protein [Aurantiacibacter gangjinensis]